METASGNMCRCCASEGVFKDLATTYHWMGEEEIYGDMLRECFDIQLSSMENADGGICEVCITQLRNASNFKKQVLLTEEQFKSHLQNVFKPGIVKVEVTRDEGNSTDDNATDDGMSGPEFDDIPIKIEGTTKNEKEDLEIKPKKRSSVKPSTSTAKKSVSSDDEPLKKHAVRRSGRKKSTKITLDKKLNFCSFISIRPVGNNGQQSVAATLRKKQQLISQNKRLTELDWHFDNIKTILKWSTATPMRCRVADRFACNYCFDQFADPATLKQHNFARHSEETPDFLKVRSLSRHIVYLDITDLSCKICNLNIGSLQDLMDHLKEVHNEVIHTQIKNQIVPFKFVGGKLLCTLCPMDLEGFSDIQDHMKDHYKNYICDFCNSAFVIRGKLLEHKKNIHLV